MLSKDIPKFNELLVLGREFHKPENDPPPEKRQRVTRSQAPPKTQRERIQELIDEGAMVGKVPLKLPGFAFYSDPASRELGLMDGSVYLRLKKYLNDNGNFLMLPAPGDGSCMFHSAVRMLEGPQEYTHIHCRRDCLLLAAEHPDFFYDMLEVSIQGNYGFLRMPEEEYQTKKALKSFNR